MIGLNAGAMFLAKYAIFESWARFVFNLNMIYMIGLMVATMAFTMLLSMLHLYRGKQMNAVIFIGSSRAYAPRPRSATRTASRHDPASFRRDPDVRTAEIVRS